MDDVQKNGAVAEKPAEVALGRESVSPAEAKMIIERERQVRIARTSQRIQAILDEENMELRVNQVVQLSFR